MKYGLHGKLKAKSGKGQELAEILVDASKLVKSKAKGCILYLVSLDTTNSDIIWITEVWESKEDHKDSLSLEGVRELISKAIPIIDGAPEKGVEMQVMYGIN